MADGILVNSRISDSLFGDDVIVLHINTNQYNSLWIQDIKSIIEAIEMAGQNARIKMLIISGVGPCFCTGLDVEHLLLSDRNEIIDTLYYLELLIFTIVNSPIIIVSAINGHAIGGGAVLAVASDYRIASDDKRIKIGFPEYRKGLFIPKLMRELISLRTNADIKMLLFGEYVEVDKAIQLGIVDECSGIDLITQTLMRFERFSKETTRIYKSHNIVPISELIPYVSNVEYNDLCNRILGIGGI